MTTTATATTSATVSLTMTMNLQLFIHIGQKALVRSVTNRGPVALPEFYKNDSVFLEVTLIADNPAATAQTPFLVIDPSQVDGVRAAIGNGLGGSARRVMAQQVNFIPGQTSHSGVLELGTLEMAAYLAFPDAWTPASGYTSGSLVYHDNALWEALGQVTEGVEPGSDAARWITTELDREPLFFEVELVKSGKVTTVLHAPVTVAQPVMEEPLTTPDLVEDVDALADALHRRLPDTSTVRWTRNKDLNDPVSKAAIAYDPQKPWFATQVAWDPIGARYYQAVREIKEPVAAVALDNYGFQDQSAQLPGGVTWQPGMRVLLAAQTDPTENGIYTVQLMAGQIYAGLRALDANASTDFRPGFAVCVAGGFHAGERWIYQGSPSTVVVIDQNSQKANHALVFEQGAGNGPIALTEKEFFGPASGDYEGPAYDAAAQVFAGDIRLWSNAWYQAIAPSTGVTPPDSRYWGLLAPFAPNNSLFANVRLQPQGGLVVAPDMGGLLVDFIRGVPAWFEVTNVADLRLLSGAKAVDFAILPSGDMYQLVALPANNPAHWVRVYDVAAAVLRPGLTRVAHSQPSPLTVAGTAQIGGSPEAARADHVHGMPGLVTQDTDGFMSKDDKALLDRLASVGASTGGFDAPVRVLLADGNRIYVGGDFTRYGSTLTPRLAKLDWQGRVDAQFAIGEGFTQTIHYLALASDGDVLVGTKTVPNTYQGTGGGLVWKLQPSGAPRSGFACPNPIHIAGSEELIGLAGLKGRVAMLTPQTLRTTDLTGANSVTAPGTLRFHALAALEGDFLAVSSRAYTSPGVAQEFNGQANPRGLKKVDGLATTNPQVDPQWVTGGGTGAGTSILSLVPWSGYDGAYLYGACPRPAASDNGVDSEWGAGGNQELFEGIYKIRLDGTAATDFDVHIATATPADAPLLFCADSTGRLYFGGNVTRINGVTVSPWSLYRITRTGQLDRVFELFNDKVLCCVLRDDNTLVAGGEFTQYGTVQVGRITFLDVSGGIQGTGGELVDGPNEGRIITSSTPPDVAATPKYMRWLWRKNDQTPPVLSIYDEIQGQWVSICNICTLPPTDLQLPLVTFTPPSGSQVIPNGGSLDVSMTCPGHEQATLLYTLDGSEPTSINERTFSHAGPLTLSLDAKTTIRVKATQEGWMDSGLSQALYDVQAGGDSTKGVWLINVQFGVGPTDRRQGAAVYNWAAAADRWNYFGLGYYGQMIDAEGSLREPRMRFELTDNLTGKVAGFLASGVYDKLMLVSMGARLLAQGDGATTTAPLMIFTLEDLPPGAYDLAVFLHGPEDRDLSAAQLTNIGGENGYVTSGAIKPLVYSQWWKNTATWLPATHYVEFTNVEAGFITPWLNTTAKPQLRLLVSPVAHTYTDAGDIVKTLLPVFINGLQIRRRRQTSMPLLYPEHMSYVGQMCQMGLPEAHGGQVAGATIRFELAGDGSEPPDPSEISPIYPGPFELWRDTRANIIVKARAWFEDWEPSRVSRYVYRCLS